MFQKELSATVLRKTTHGLVVALKLKTQDSTMTAMEIINYLDGKKSFSKIDFEFTDTNEIPVSRSQTLNFELDNTNPSINTAKSINLNNPFIVNLVVALVTCQLAGVATSMDSSSILMFTGGRVALSSR